MLTHRLGEIPAHILKNQRPERFFSMPAEYLDPQVASTLLQRLNQNVDSFLVPLAKKIDPLLTQNQKLNYTESLPKVMRVNTLRLDKPQAQKIWNSCKIEELIPPNQARKMCEMLFGRELDPECGKQIVCYKEGDYFSPHNDHHPEFDHMKHGYIDFHYYFCNEDVEAQYLVKENNGHLNQMYPIGKPIGLNIYELPFWHYTTPLMAKTPNANKAVRWIIMYTFYFKEQPKATLPTQAKQIQQNKNASAPSFPKRARPQQSQGMNTQSKKLR